MAWSGYAMMRFLDLHQDGVDIRWAIVLGLFGDLF
jgi:hypothetical protein